MKVEFLKKNILSGGNSCLLIFKEGASNLNPIRQNGNS
jgi:hypothetical protein